MIFQLLALILVANPLVDWYMIEKKNIQVNHRKHALILEVCVIAALGLNVIYSDGFSIFDGISIGALFAPIRWIIHDLLLNILREKPFDYLGASAVTDQYLRKHELNQFVHKAIWLCIALIISIIIQIIEK